MAWSTAIMAGGCSVDGADSATSREGPDLGLPPATTGGTGAGVPNPGTGGLPPEQERESGFGLPVLSGQHIWSANPLSGRVAVIDAQSLEIELARAGFAPTELAALPAGEGVTSAAIVLNARSHDASVLELTGSGIRASSAPTHAGANAWSVSASGRWALAWTDATRIENADPAESYQDITLIELGSGAPSAARLSVGYRPERVFFDARETRAFVVCEPGISVIELDSAGPSVSRDLALSRGPGLRAKDISIVPEGTHALIRFEGSPDVVVVNLEDGMQTSVALSGPVTDLDLVADGTAALAVVRGEIASGTAGSESGGQSGNGGSAAVTDFGPSEVFVLPIPGIVEDPLAFERVTVDELVGSVAVSETGSVAALYTTAVDGDYVVVLPTSPGAVDYLQPRAVSVRAPARAVFVAPDAEHAVVALESHNASTGAFAVVPLGRALPARIETTDAPVTGVAFAPSPTTSALLTADAGRTAYLVHLPSLLVESIALPSAPLAAGIVPGANLGFVSQQHPDGRVSFVDLATAEQRTLTGFELTARVIDGD